MRIKQEKHVTTATTQHMAMYSNKQCDSVLKHVGGCKLTHVTPNI